MISLNNVQSQLDRIVEGFSIVRYGDIMPFEIKEVRASDREMKETDVYLMASKSNYPQYMNLKVNISSGLITEIYPSKLRNEFDANAKLLYEPIPTETEFDLPPDKLVPYFSIKVVKGFPIKDKIEYIPEIREGVPCFIRVNTETGLKTRMDTQFKDLEEFKSVRYKHLKDIMATNAYHDWVFRLVGLAEPSYFIVMNGMGLSLKGIIYGYTPMSPQYKVRYSQMFVE